MANITRTYVVDNGGDTCKVGYAGQQKPSKIIPNYGVRPKRERRLFVADQIEEILDFSSLYYRRPFEKGYITHWDVQKTVWNRIFGKSVLKVSPKTSALLITEPFFNPSAIQREMDETIFETYQFGAYCRSTAAPLALRGHNIENDSFGEACSVVVDAGHSFTHIVPMFNGTPLNYAVKRVDVGGKLMTNFLKETVSYRAWNMMDETHTMDDIKKKLCFVSMDFLHELKDTRQRAKSRLAREYVLPNGSTRLTGYVREGAGGGEPADQTLKLQTERISVPELLFTPSDIGLKQAGIAEAIVQAIDLCPPALRGLMYNSILITGGSTLFPNFQKRLLKELTALAPVDFGVTVEQPANPIEATWLGGSVLANGEEDFTTKFCVTRTEFAEYGPDICRRRFFQNSH